MLKTIYKIWASCLGASLKYGASCFGLRLQSDDSSQESCHFGELSCCPIDPPWSKPHPPPLQQLFLLTVPRCILCCSCYLSLFVPHLLPSVCALGRLSSVIVAFPGYFHFITKTCLFKYTANTTKNWFFFSDKNTDIFHISAQNIDCEYSLEPPRRGGSNEYRQSMFLSKNKKNNIYPCKPQFYYMYIKVEFKGVKII